MVPLALALWGMITRAVALEFRHLAEARWQRFSDFAFGFSSLVVAFFGGMALGAVMHGFPLTHDAGTRADLCGRRIALHLALQHLDRHRLGDRGDARRRACSSAPASIMASRSASQAARWSNVVFYLALASAVITIVFSIAIFPWAAHKWLGPHFWVWAHCAAGRDRRGGEDAHWPPTATRI